MSDCDEELYRSLTTYSEVRKWRRRFWGAVAVTVVIVALLLIMTNGCGAW
jgi:hypothetical protein